MSYCRSCGSELREGDQFCPKCGASLTQREREVGPRRRPVAEHEKACFGPAGSGGGLWGAISGAVFLIGIGVLWYYDLWWPGIIFLIGLLAIIGGIVAYSRR